MELKAILFDIDGVLVDVSRSYRHTIEETVAHFTGRTIEQGTILRYRNLGGFKDEWKLTHAVVSDAGISVSFGRIVEEFQRRYRGENWDGFISEEEPLISLRTLERLQESDLVLGIVTGRSEVEAQWSLDRFGWKRYFPLVIPREKQEGREIPDPFPFRHALAMLDAAGRTIQPSETLVLGSTVDDIEAAIAAGMWAIGVIAPQQDRAEHQALLEERGAHHVITDPDTLPKLLKKLPDILGKFLEEE